MSVANVRSLSSGKTSSKDIWRFILEINLINVLNVISHFYLLVNYKCIWRLILEKKHMNAVSVIIVFHKKLPLKNISGLTLGRNHIIVIIVIWLSHRKVILEPMWSLTLWKNHSAACIVTLALEVIITKDRTKLRPENTEQMIFLNANLPLLSIQDYSNLY